MIKIENFEVVGLEHAIRGMRNPMNSWNKSDSNVCAYSNHTFHCKDCEYIGMCYADEKDIETNYIVGLEDHDLMMKLRNAGTDHRKYLRMITVYLDITAPLYWWKEFDTYKVGTVANSCSTMHKIHEKEFTLDDFSCEHLDEVSVTILEDVINHINDMRAWFNEIDNQLKNDELSQEKIIELCELKKDKWWQMIQLLPSSYNQRRTIMLNYEVLANMYKSRKGHKLDEWRLHDVPSDHRGRTKDFASGVWGFCDWIESLPYSEIITGNAKKISVG